MTTRARSVRGSRATAGVARPTKYNRVKNTASRQPSTWAPMGRSAANQACEPIRYERVTKPKPATARSGARGVIREPLPASDAAATTTTRTSTSSSFHVANARTIAAGTPARANNPAMTTIWNGSSQMNQRSMPPTPSEAGGAGRARARPVSDPGRARDRVPAAYGALR